MKDQIRDTWKCPECREWVELPLREQQRFKASHLGECRDTMSRRPVATVKRATLWDGVEDTYQTEAELNGFRARQGALAL